MSDEVLFYMPGLSRKILIDEHRFYVEQARKRLLSQFENIEAESRQAADDWLKRNSGRFDPDNDDPQWFYDTASEVESEFYLLLSNMKDRIRLSVVAGMFHEWEKQLRGWLVEEIKHWHRGEEALKKVRKAPFVGIIELLECIGWPIRGTNYFCIIDACHHVVNLYKHGNGDALDLLKQKYPEYLGCTLAESGPFSGIEYRDHRHLKVSDDQFQAFSDSIVAFWQAVPEYIYCSEDTQVPDWLGKAMQKDNGGH